MEPDLHSILLAAAESPFGVSITTTNVQLTRNKLYKIRREFAEFKHLSIVSPPTSPETQLWIVKKEPQHGAPES